MYLYVHSGPRLSISSFKSQKNLARRFDLCWKSLRLSVYVIPAKAGIQLSLVNVFLDPGFRRDDVKDDLDLFLKFYLPKDRAFNCANVFAVCTGSLVRRVVWARKSGQGMILGLAGVLVWDSNCWWYWFKFLPIINPANGLMPHNKIFDTVWDICGSGSTKIFLNKVVAIYPMFTMPPIMAPAEK